MIISFFVFILFCEIALRVTKFSTPHYGKPDLYTGARYMPNAYYSHNKEGKTEGYINSKGLRDYEYSYQKPDSVFRILVFGDSYTAAFQVDLDSSFFNILEKKLNSNPTKNKSIKYEVLSFGVDGFGTASSYYYYLNEGIKYNPDLVILAFLTGNDFRNNSIILEGNKLKPFFEIDSNGVLVEDLSFREVIAPKLSPINSFLRPLKNKSYLISLLIERKNLLFSNIVPSIRKIEEIAKINEINLLQLLPYFKERYETLGKYYHGFDDYGSLGCDCHWNNDGHKLAGNILFEYLIKSQLLTTE